MLNGAKVLNRKTRRALKYFFFRFYSWLSTVSCPIRERERDRQTDREREREIGYYSLFKSVWLHFEQNFGRTSFLAGYLSSPVQVRFTTLFPPVVTGEGTYVSGGSVQAQILKTYFVFLPFLITIFIHLWQAVQQRVFLAWLTHKPFVHCLLFLIYFTISIFLWVVQLRYNWREWK